MAIEFSGTAGQLRTNFKTELHTFVSGGRTFIANDRDPQIPDALSPVVTGFASLNNYRSTMELGTSTKAAALVKHSKVHTLFDDYTLDQLNVSPGDIAQIYNIPSTATGAGVAVGVVSASNVNLRYLSNYQTTFKLPGKAPTIVIDGNDPGETADAYDPLAQLELLSAVAPSANLYLYTTSNIDPTDGLNYALIRAVDDNKVQVLLYDAESCEGALGADGNAFINFVAEQASAQGMTVVAASGNGGSDSCQAGVSFGHPDPVAEATSGLSVNGYASTPFVTAVGATDFYYANTVADPTEALLYWNTTNSGKAGYTSAKGYIPEQPFNVSDGSFNYDGGADYAVATGGGISDLGLGTSGYPTPSWQIPVLERSSDPAVSAAAKAGKGRVVPDVAMFGGADLNASSYMLCLQANACVDTTPTNITYDAFAGPNVSSATFAGVVALVVQAHGTQGNINPVLYSLYQKQPQGTAAIFHAPGATISGAAAGSNTVACKAGTPNCGSGGYLVESPSGPLAYQSTTSGYNAAVGLGSVNVANLIHDWASPATTQTTTTFTLTAPGTSTRVTSFVHGKSLQENITVSSGAGTPTGDVAVLTSSPLPLNGATTYFTLSDGTVTDVVHSSALPGGTYQIRARYAGDGEKYAPSVSAPFSVKVTPETSVVILTPSAASGSTITYGTDLTVQALVGSATNGDSYGEPTGSVTVLDVNSTGTRQSYVLQVASTNYALFSAQLAVGTHTLTFKYSGDPSYLPSSASMTIKVSAAAQASRDFGLDAVPSRLK